MTPAPLRVLALALALVLLAPAAALAAPPDPLARGPYTVTTVDPVLMGTADLQEPNAAGGPLTGPAAAATVQVRGSIYYPANRATGSPVILLVHGNHGSCDSGSAPNCTAFKRNDRGYAYLGENLATWGYTVMSLDQDQLIYYQDNAQGKGMHQRRILMAAALDALYAANQAPMPANADNNLGAALVGKLDFSRVGLMGHSRGGDAVSSFIDYNRDRPAPGRKYNLRGVISLAPVDYERRAPYGVPYLTILPYCDGDVSNLQGARFFERSQYIEPGDPFPRIQMSLHGANHNYFNSVWFVDADDSTGTDAACGTSQPNNIRLTGGTYDLTTRGSGNPALMGDQEKAGLAMMSSFFRRYVGGDKAFDPYMTGEVSADGTTPQLPASACPTSPSGTRIPCFDRVMTSYFAAPAERRDVLRPETDNPLTVSALGTSITGSGFSNPYRADGGIAPIPDTTPGGFDWCNPEPTHFAPSQLGIAGLPTATKGCPLPAAAALGGQNGIRENGPVNQSYGLQLALAWDQPASIGTRIPAASGDVSGFKSLALGAAVNFFDPRNPSRGTDAIWNPGLTTQNFTIEVTDKAGKVGSGRGREPTLRHRPAPDHRLDHRPHPRRAQPSARAAGGLRRPRRRPHGPAEDRVQVRRRRNAGDRLDRARRRALPGSRRRPDGLHGQARRRRADRAGPHRGSPAGNLPRGLERRGRRPGERECTDDDGLQHGDRDDRSAEARQAPADGERNELAVRRLGDRHPRAGQWRSHQQGPACDREVGEVVSRSLADQGQVPRHGDRDREGGRQGRGRERKDHHREVGQHISA